MNTDKCDVTIMIVEDEDAIRMATRIRVQSMGYRVVTAENGRRCLDQLADTDVDLILMDIRMPVMNGLETIGHLQRNAATAAIPVVVVSASPGDQDQSLKLGANFFVR